MKAAHNFCIFALLTTVAVICHAQTANIPSPTPYTVVRRGLDSQTWQRTVYNLSPSGQVIPQVQSYEEIASGLNFSDPATGELTPSREEVDILPDGSGAALYGRQRVYFPINIATGTIKLITPDGLTIESRPAGLSYDDGANTVLIAEVTNSIGELISSNQVLYPDALGTGASLLYTYRKSGLEQDVILTERLPAPERFGFDSADTRLQMLTEFLNAPIPDETFGPTNLQEGLQDTTLTFGAAKMIQGKAFLLGNASSDTSQSVSVYKSWIQLDSANPGRDQLLVEQVPYARMSPQFATLPKSAKKSTKSGNSALYRVSARRLLPSVQASDTGTNKIHFAMNTLLQRQGVVLDYNTVDGDLTNYIWQGDETFYVSGPVYLFGTGAFDGGAVIKYASGASIDLNEINVSGSAFLPVIFTAKDDNTVGMTISGSTGNPTGYYANPALYGSIAGLQNFRISYAQCAFESLGSTALGLTNGQIVNCASGVFAGGGNFTLNLRNMLFAHVQVEFNLLDGEGGSAISAQNTTFAFSAFLITNYESSSVEFIRMTNCVMAAVTNSGLPSKVSVYCNGSNNGFYNSFSGQLGVPFGSNPQSTTVYPFQAVGGGAYYLTNECVFHSAGTTNIDPALLAELPQKTTWAPTFYVETNISSLNTLGPAAPRDTNSSPDIGFNYDPIDYLFGGCDLSNNLTFTTGTSAGWFEETNGVSSSGQPYGISLNSGANLSFNGNVTEPCNFPRYTMVQEGQNGIWTNSGSMGGLMFNGGSPTPQLSANFTKFTSDDWSGNLFGDNSASGDAAFKNCEFYNFASSTYDLASLTFTNSLFFRFDQDFSSSPDLTFENCTFYNGGMYLGRSSPVTWLIENCSFDGTAFKWSDSYHGTSYTTINYNAYNTSNLSWKTNSLYGGYYGTNEVAGLNDLMVTNYNWQTSWFGNFYLPVNSPLIMNGSTYANLLGLYHFTAVTNQVPDATNIVTIGYHYVATDQYGNPLDSNGDGIPDYLEDPTGNGSGNWDTTLFLNVIISQPQNGSTLP